jgi:hypothetical protein
MPLNIDPKLLPDGFYVKWRLHFYGDSKTGRPGWSWSDKRKFKHLVERGKIDESVILMMKYKGLAFSRTMYELNIDLPDEKANELFIALLAEEMRNEDLLDDATILESLSQLNIKLTTADQPGARIRDVDLPTE